MLRKIDKGGQEEIVGFVLIMVIVAIVFLVFLGISVRKGEVDVKESSEVYGFLESAMEYTTECAVRFLPDYESFGELFKECYSGNNCLSGKSACEVLNETAVDLFDKSWQVGTDNKIKGYDFRSVYLAGNESMQGDEILVLAGGNCTSGAVRGASYLMPAFPGKIENSLRICF